MKKNSVAKKNVIVLILSLLPFVIGLSYSLYRSSDRNYFSKAINIAGSQRMRTILIANYAHQIYNQDFKIDQKDLAILEELYVYKEYFEALKYGNSSLEMKPNNFHDIKNKLEELTPLVDNYISNVNGLILDTDKKNKMRSILVDSLKIKNGFHEVTELYQLHNDLYIERQKTIDTIMIILAAGITIGGLFLTSKIKQQEYHANFDALTKLKNRHNLISYIEDKSSLNFSIYFIDLNKFKIINDTYGHEIGDEILVGVSRRLVKVFGRDTLYRYGGDEFIVLWEDVKKPGFEAEINRKIDMNIKSIKELLSEPIVDSYGREHFVGLAMGVISSNVAIDNWDALINLSDDLMYDSKSIPENVVIFRNKKDLKHRIKFLKGIDSIFSKESIKLQYQPIYTITDKRNILFNVTSRLEKDGEEFYASEFLHILKRKGYLTDLDKNTMQVLDSDYSDNIVKDPGINSKVRYIVTLSEDTLINSSSNDFFSVIKSLDIPESRIIIKIHENFLYNEKIQESLEILRSMGFVIAMDNFTLDLSLKDLYKYRDIEIFKIDNSLVSAVFTHEHSVDILKEFVSMLVKNDKTVIVEGIDRSDLEFSLKELSTSDMNKILYSEKYSKRPYNKLSYPDSCLIENKEFLRDLQID